MDGMFLGVATLFRELFSETTDPSPTSAPTTTLATSTESSTVANSTNATFLIADADTMHYTTATGLVVTGLIVLIVVSCFILCFVLRKYCRCAYDLRYSLNYGKGQKGTVLVPTEDQMEAGDMSKRSTFNAADSGIGINSRHPSQTKLPHSRPQTPSQQRPPRPPPAATRYPQTPEQRPLLEKEGTGEPKSLSVQPTGLYPATETSQPPDTQE